MDQFSTERLLVQSWRPVLQDPARRQSLETALSNILSPRVTKHLPAALQLDHQRGSISSWIDERAEESEVLLAHRKSNKDLVGLAILARDPDAAELPAIHIGYTIAETVWGQGIATELVIGLVSWLVRRKPLRLIAGVDRSNPASSRVLQKAGFVSDSRLSTRGTEMYALDLA